MIKYSTFSPHTKSWNRLFTKEVCNRGVPCSLLKQLAADKPCPLLQNSLMVSGIMSLICRLGLANAYINENAERFLRLSFLSVWLGCVIERSLMSKLFSVLTTIIFVKILLTDMDIYLQLKAKQSQDTSGLETSL